MAINKDLEGKFLEFIGIDKIETEEDFNQFKETFNSTFVPRKTAHEDEEIRGKAVANRIGQLNSKLVDFGKSIGMDVSFEKLREKKLEDVLDEYKETVTGKFSTLESKVKEGADKKFNDLHAQFEEAQKSINSYKEANETLQSQLSEKENQFQNEIKSFKVGSMLKDIKGSIAWVDGMNDVQRAGFDTLLNSSYRFDLEGDNLKVTDKDGNLIPNKDKAGTFLDAQSVIKGLADANGLLKKNNLKDTKKSNIFTSSSKVEDKPSKVSSSYERRIAEINGR